MPVAFLLLNVKKLENPVATKFDCTLFLILLTFYVQRRIPSKVILEIKYTIWLLIDSVFSVWRCS